MWRSVRRPSCKGWADDGWTTSYVVPSTLVSALEANGSRINLDLSSSCTGLYLALYDNTVTPDVDTDPQSYTRLAAVEYGGSNRDQLVCRRVSNLTCPGRG